MKTAILLALSIIGTALFTGCESHHHRHGYYGRAPAYQYGTGPGYNQGWDRR
jgi:hypothetical protein